MLFSQIVCLRVTYGNINAKLSGLASLDILFFFIIQNQLLSCAFKSLISSYRNDNFFNHCVS